MTTSHSAPLDPRANFDATSETGVPVSDVTRVERLAEARRAIMQALGQRIVGQHEVIDLLLTCLFAGGHALFVGVPGLAKTLLIQSLAEVLSLDFQRIQFTPDLMPSDIVGTEILEEDPETGRRRFRFARGPIFSQILLADEIAKLDNGDSTLIIAGASKLRDMNSDGRLDAFNNGAWTGSLQLDQCIAPLSGAGNTFYGQLFTTP